MVMRHGSQGYYTGAFPSSEWDAYPGGWQHHEIAPQDALQNLSVNRLMSICFQASNKVQTSKPTYLSSLRLELD